MTAARSSRSSSGSSSSSSSSSQCFEAASADKKIAVPNVLGTVEDMPYAGTAVFQHEGKELKSLVKYVDRYTTGHKDRFAQGSRIDGNLKFNEGLRIDGEVYGTVESVEANPASIGVHRSLGFELIGRVPATLHTPLMSGTNAIHGIVVLGAMIILGGALVLIAISALGALRLTADNSLKSYNRPDSQVRIDDDGTSEIARRSRGTPRIANRLPGLRLDTSPFPAAVSWVSSALRREASLDAVAADSVDLVVQVHHRIAVRHDQLELVDGRRLDRVHDHHLRRLRRRGRRIPLVALSGDGGCRRRITRGDFASSIKCGQEPNGMKLTQVAPYRQFIL